VRPLTTKEAETDVALATAAKQDTNWPLRVLATARERDELQAQKEAAYVVVTGGTTPEIAQAMRRASLADLFKVAMRTIDEQQARIEELEKAP
jgi:hypothetical protein